MDLKPLTIQSLVKQLESIQGEKNKFYWMGHIVTYSITLNPPAALDNIRLAEKEMKLKFPKVLVE